MLLAPPDEVPPPRALLLPVPVEPAPVLPVGAGEGGNALLVLSWLWPRVLGDGELLLLLLLVMTSSAVSRRSTTPVAGRLPFSMLAQPW